MCDGLGLVKQALLGPSSSAFAIPPTSDTIKRLREGGEAIEGAKVAKGKVESIKIWDNNTQDKWTRYHTLYVDAQEWYPSYLKERCGVYVADIHIKLEGTNLTPALKAAKL